MYLASVLIPSLVQLASVGLSEPGIFVVLYFYCFINKRIICGSCSHRIVLTADFSTTTFITLFDSISALSHKPRTVNKSVYCFFSAAIKSRNFDIQTVCTSKLHGRNCLRNTILLTGQLLLPTLAWTSKRNTVLPHRKRICCLLKIFWNVFFLNRNVQSSIFALDRVMPIMFDCLQMMLFILLCCRAVVSHMHFKHVKINKL